MACRVNFEALTQEGYRLTIVSTNCLAGLKTKIESRQEQANLMVNLLKSICSLSQLDKA
jgi:hypothetical protein